MTDPTKPTPTPDFPKPWTLDQPFRNDYDGRIWTRIIDANGRQFWSVNTQFPDTQQWLAEMVTATNAHAGLVEALRETATLCRSMNKAWEKAWDDEREDWLDVLQRADAALRAAGVEP